MGQVVSFDAARVTVQRLVEIKTTINSVKAPKAKEEQAKGKKKKSKSKQDIDAILCRLDELERPVREIINLLYENEDPEDQDRPYIEDDEDLMASLQHIPEEVKYTIVHLIYIAAAEDDEIFEEANEA